MNANKINLTSKMQTSWLITIWRKQGCQIVHLFASQKVTYWIFWLLMNCKKIHPALLLYVTAGLLSLWPVMGWTTARHYVNAAGMSHWYASIGQLPKSLPITFPYKLCLVMYRFYCRKGIKKNVYWCVNAINAISLQEVLPL